jgi:hypothetical protein
MVAGQATSSFNTAPRRMFILAAVGFLLWTAFLVALAVATGRKPEARTRSVSVPIQA